MRIDKFWVVTIPGLVSTLDDILFETDVKGLALQFRGGLREEDVHSSYTSREEAEKAAKRILAAAGNYRTALQEANQ